MMHPDWKPFFQKEAKFTYFQNLKSFIQQRRLVAEVYPAVEDLFRVFELGPKDIKIVILGQDPYPTKGDADGLAFSARNAISIPKSLRRIFEALEKDYGSAYVYDEADLTRWHNQGVFLLNTILTVEEGKAKAHEGKGWEIFTAGVLKEIGKHNPNVIYLLWGASAHLFEKHITGVVLKAEHPVAGVYQGNKPWDNDKCFSKANFYLEQRGIQPIDW